MNLFATSDCPRESAYALDDKRANKMLIESCQLMCTALRWAGVDDPQLYKLSHQHHPITKWTARSRGNFLWVGLHALHLADVYSGVYHRTHASLAVAQLCLKYILHIQDGELQPFHNSSLVRVDNVSVTESYRQTMNTKWANDRIRPTWHGRGHPDWYRNLA